MKMKLLAWLFIIFCSHVLSSLALENFLASRNRGFDISNRLSPEQEAHGENRTIPLHGDGDDREYVVKHGMVNSRKARRGRGSNGGATVVHHPRSSDRSAASLLKPSFFFSTACGSLGLLLLDNVVPI
ncbi:hypothetical protein F0562_024523 [Nyssa sinensis]|uniref:Uncharacterized protein n=1 Tax=Nyssa sinensis TaxID=561372 RepID=A0A5J5BD34_9ASTE|nr:hypothetical protein F0562_024523 [Nyssa sinensis]